MDFLLCSYLCFSHCTTLEAIGIGDCLHNRLFEKEHSVREWQLTSKTCTYTRKHCRTTKAAGRASLKRGIQASWKAENESKSLKKEKRTLELAWHIDVISLHKQFTFGRVTGLKGIGWPESLHSSCQAVDVIKPRFSNIDTNNSYTEGDRCFSFAFLLRTLSLTDISSVSHKKGRNRWNFLYTASVLGAHVHRLPNFILCSFFTVISMMFVRRMLNVWYTTDKYWWVSWHFSLQEVAETLVWRSRNRHDRDVIHFWSRTSGR